MTSDYFDRFIIWEFLVFNFTTRENCSETDSKAECCFQ
uniref:Uncharacterized protein n=1 Tax=Anguilla anguilla TaxID=7936 RepID=A0A0E9P7A9_ANGAN